MSIDLLNSDVARLIGPITPHADPGLDAERTANVEKVIGLTDFLLDQLREIEKHKGTQGGRLAAVYLSGLLPT